MSRNTFRKALTELGLKSANCVAIDNIVDAQAAYQKEKFALVICEHVVNKDVTGLDFFSFIKTTNPDYARSIFFLISDENALVVAAQAAEEDVDAVIARPFTMQSILDKVRAMVEEKAQPSEYRTKAIDALKLLKAGDSASALRLSQSIHGLNPKPWLSSYVEGACHLAVAKYKEAEDCLKKGALTEPPHYRSAVQLSELLFEQKRFREAYDLCKIIAKFYPPSPKRIPRLVHLSIATGNFEEIAAFYDLYLDLPVTSPEINKYVAAGLIVHAKHFLKSNDTTSAASLLNKAARIGKTQPKILKEVVLCLYKANLTTEATKLLAQCPDEVRKSPEVVAAESGRG